MSHLLFGKSRHNPHVVMFVLAGTLGFYLGLLTAVLLVGQDAFNAAFPMPWRMLTAVPVVAANVVYWRAISS